MRIAIQLIGGVFLLGLSQSVTTVEQTVPGTRRAPALVESFDGLGAGFTGPQGTATLRNPSDNSLAVGPDHLVQTVNTRMAIVTKKGRRFETTGRVLYGPVNTNNVFRGFGGACEQHNNGDAVVRYDQLANRWLIVMPIFSRADARPDQPPVWTASDKPYASPPGRRDQPGAAVPLFQPSASASAREQSGELRRDLAVAASGREGGPLAPIRLGRTLADGRTRIETVAVDDYIAQVLAGEGQPRAGDAAQQALAITARTFAMANRNRHRREGFDLCDTTHCQVVRAATATTTRAAQATSGRMLLNQGQPAFVFYSASCGGRTESASEVWPGAIDYPGEASVHDNADVNEAAWESDVRVQDIERALRAAGLRGDRLRDIRVVARNKSNRVSRVRVEGLAPPEMSGHEFRMAVGRVAGFQAMKSTAFDVTRTSSGYHFRGRGFGHGVGLCVVGAGTRAARGATADDILKFYYPGLTIGAGSSASARPDTGELRRDPAGAASGGVGGLTGPRVAPVVTDVVLALPGTEESDRGTLLSLIRKSRDEIVKATGTIPPARLKVTVHPTVDSFGRATGQPWWVSGATVGLAIDLLPLTTLKQQGQLDRTVRHEVAHALLDGALSTRPMWVREGAAAYFASPQASRPSNSRVTCPSDAELLRPISAGAQREAYARAEACFAKGIADGKRWDQVK